MVLSETISVMLLTHAKCVRFTRKTIPDTNTTAQVLLGLSRVRREAVDDIVKAANNAGGTADPNPTQDLGFIFGRNFEDPDGHIWETIWMNLPAAQ
jgi:predicted lactoylglutathione lyase